MSGTKRFPSESLIEVRMTIEQAVIMRKCAESKGVYYEDYVTMGGIIAYTELASDEIVSIVGGKSNANEMAK